MTEFDLPARFLSLVQPPRAMNGVPSSAELAPGSKVLWVSSPGGHLWELSLIEKRMMASPESVWVTSDCSQSRGMLGDRRHHFVDHVAPRDVRAALRAAGQVAHLLARERFDACVSTGAAVAAVALPLAAAVGVPTFYVESLARPHGPSLTGRIVALAPRVRTSTPYRSWASTRWHYDGSSLGRWTASTQPAVERPLKVLVTLGTSTPYRFDRAVDASLQVLGPEDDVVWQLGCTSRRGLPGVVLDQVSPQRMVELSGWSDVVIAHSGVGSIFQQLELGNSPLLAVRTSAHAEHVDDHQRGIAELTRQRGLTDVMDLARPTRSALVAAAARTVTRMEPSPAAVVAG